MRLLILFLVFFASSASANCVVLLHGLGRTAASMAAIEISLMREGYQVVNRSYPSTDLSIEELAEQSLPLAVARCETEPVHFVTHSLGGILLRHWIGSAPSIEIGRVVMMGPPNQGSEIVDELAEVPGFEWANGPAGLQLGTSPTGFVAQLPSVNFELGVIAGTVSPNPYYSHLIPGLDDGKVSVDSTRVEGMADHITLPVTHTFMMVSRGVIMQIKHFLQNGEFEEEKE